MFGSRRNSQEAGSTRSFTDEAIDEVVLRNVQKIERRNAARREAAEEWLAYQDPDNLKLRAAEAYLLASGALRGEFAPLDSDGSPEELYARSAALASLATMLSVTSPDPEASR